MKLAPNSLATAAALFALTASCTSTAFDHPARVTSADPAAEVVVLRSDESTGSLLALTVLLDDEKLVRLRAGRWTRLRLRAGVHDFQVADVQGADTAPNAGPGDDVQTSGLRGANIERLHLEDGRTYYLLVSYARTERTLLERDSNGVLPAALSGSGGDDAPAVEDTRFLFSVDEIPEERARTLMSEYERIRSD